MTGWNRDGGNKRIYPTDTANDDLIVGDTNTEWASGTQQKMFFDKSKGAFRAGEINGNSWNDASRGVASAAFGGPTTASGVNSFAAGLDASASGTYSTAFGRGQCSGQSAVALGRGTASGTESLVCGSGATASGTNSVAFGNNAVASGAYASAICADGTASGAMAHTIGHAAIAHRFGQFSQGGRFISEVGDSQSNRFLASLQTTDATATTMLFDKGSFTSNAVTLTGQYTNVLTIPVSKAHRFRIEGMARRTDSTSDAAGFTITGTIIRGASGNATFISTPAVTNDRTAGASAWTLGVTLNTADSTNNYLVLTATGQAGATIRWTVEVNTVEVG